MDPHEEKGREGTSREEEHVRGERNKGCVWEKGHSVIVCVGPQPSRPDSGCVGRRLIARCLSGQW